MAKQLEIAVMHGVAKPLSRKIVCAQDVQRKQGFGNINLKSTKHY
jgi:inosine-uridine nucleoside N-ribohydrolase